MSVREAAVPPGQEKPREEATTTGTAPKSKQRDNRAAYALLPHFVHR